MTFKDYYQLDEQVEILNELAITASFAIYGILLSLGLVTAYEATTGGNLIVKPTRKLVSAVASSFPTSRPIDLTTATAVVLAATQQVVNPDKVNIASSTAKEELTKRIMDTASEIAQSSALQKLGMVTAITTAPTAGINPTWTGWKGPAVGDIPASGTRTGDWGSAESKPITLNPVKPAIPGPVAAADKIDVAPAEPGASGSRPEYREPPLAGAPPELKPPPPGFPWWILFALGGTAYAIKKYRDYKKRKAEESEEVAQEELQTTIQKAKEEKDIYSDLPYKRTPSYDVTDRLEEDINLLKRIEHSHK